MGGENHNVFGIRSMYDEACECLNALAEGVVTKKVEIPRCEGTPSAEAPTRSLQKWERVGPMPGRTGAIKERLGFFLGSVNPAAPQKICRFAYGMCKTA